MSRELAILLFTGIVIWLWKSDSRSQVPFSKALWIPLIWLLLLGSRPLSWWCWFYFGIGSGSSNEEGSPVNRLFYSAIITLSIIVLARRRVAWGALLQNNLALALFLSYLGLTILWSELPVPTTKRWIKEIGAIPVLLLILTDRDPIQAIKRIFTRCAYVLFTLSILVIKYIPEIGRDYNSHSGNAQIIGIAAQKNALGETVIVCSLIILWQLLEQPPKTFRDCFRLPTLPWIVALGEGIWLLLLSDSKTSLLCFLIGGGLLVTRHIRALDTRRMTVVMAGVFVLPLYYAADQTFNISTSLLEMLGRDATLTNRTEIWRGIQERPVDPLIGAGYLSYWDIVKTIRIGDYDLNPGTAHNGYLEIYLDGGVLGICALSIMLLATGFAHARAFIHAYPAGAVSFAIFCMLLVMNVSESVFARRGPLWSAYLLLTLGGAYLTHRANAAQRASDPVPHSGRTPSPFYTAPYPPRSSPRCRNA